MAKRSFDIGPKRRARSAGTPEKRKKEKKEAEKKNSHPRLSTRAPKRKLRDRRREEQMRNVVLIVAGTGIVIGAALYVLWLPSFRIVDVHATGYGDTASLEAIAKKELKGTYGGVIPKNSFFFYPERTIRASILDAYPSISAVSVSRSGFNSLSLKANARVSAFWWCGTPANLSAEQGTCYQADTEGLVFARAVEVGVEETTTAAPLDVLRVYAELETASTSDSYPLRARVLGAASLPAILKFERSITALGVPIASLAIRGDEADLFVEPGTRITYVIGHEKEAAQSAEVAFKNLNLTDGSLVYVDLRFDGKVYVKRHGE